jgi:hypothetical protein
MFNDKEIKQHNAAQHRHIMSMCGDDSVEKALSADEFKAKYGESHEIYSKESINDYQTAIATKVDEAPEMAEEIIAKAVSEFESLTEVLVKSETSVDSFYVKEKEVKEEVAETEEKATEEAVEEANEKE